MTKEQLADLINGRESGDEIPQIESEAAARDRLVVVFGASDDLCELRGAIEDEVGCYSGGEIPIQKHKAKWRVYEPECIAESEYDGCPHEKRIAAKLPRFKAVRGDRGASWCYDIPWPHALFHIYEDGELYCIGAVFSLDDIPWEQP